MPCAVALALLAASSPAWAAQATLVSDAHVNSAMPTVNSGTISNLNVGSGYTAFLQFDLSMLPSGTTASQVSRAVLRLYVNRVTTPGLVALAPVTGAWGEYSVTSATAPSTGSANSLFPVSQAGTFVAIDVTSLVQGWITSPTTNNGVALSAGTAIVQFDSKENDQTAHPATLDIELVEAGPAGATGATGPAGPAGLPGATGATGPAGPQGQPGATGLQGLTGPTGPQGSAGPAGLPGVQGPQGLPGSVGPNGPIGPQGLQGIPGQAGAQGIPGATGASGLSGPQGQQGTPGPVGMTFQGAYSSTTNYALADGVLYQGSSYVSLVAGNHGNTPDQSPQQWTLFAASGTPGATGPAGTPGATGPIGPAGSQGPIGPTGATGATGPQGPAVANYLGNYQSSVNYALHDAVNWLGSTYVSLIAANHGNTPDQSPQQWAILAAQGATGATGSTGVPGVAGTPGAPGQTGATGPQGPPVAFRGEWLVGTSYTIGDAVAYGGSSYIALTSNTGRQPDMSPQYWGLLVAAGAAGPAGPQGTQGIQGPTGYAGQIGATGPQGPAGPTGPAGPQGITGATGPAGSVGLTGAAGATGATGTPGINGTNGINGAPGPPGITFKGAWLAGYGYAVNDAVTFAGSTYIALIANNSSEPDLSSQLWNLLAQAGSNGPSGPTGPSATVAIGTVTTGAPGTQAAVTNTGTSSAAVLHFTIPQGATGPAGTSGSGGSTNASPFASMYHAVSFSSLYYSISNSTAIASEQAQVLTWVPTGCTATTLSVFSLQANTITVTLRSGTPGSMADTPLACTASPGVPCSATGSVILPSGSFVDLSITGANGTAAGVWTALTCT